jgi:hypothetical protein
MGSVSRHLAAAVAALAMLSVTACEARPDDEMVRPTVTRSATPQAPTDLPDLPVGQGAIGPADNVRVQGSTIHVGRRAVGLAPLRIDAWAVVPGGVYFVNRSELWFTDLRRAVPTDFKHVDHLRTTGHGTHLVFTDLEHGADGPNGRPLPVRIEYDARTGAPLSATYLP